MDRATSPIRPWLPYMLLAIVSLSVVFLCFKLASGVITPFLFACLGNFFNCLGHIFFIVRARRQGRLPSFALPFSGIMLALITGTCLALNDSSVVYMFAAGAPVSIAMPMMTAGNVFLTVLFGLIVMHEKMHLKRAIGLVCIIAGIVLLNV